MAQCVCGYTHAHIQHVCWAIAPTPGTRCEPGPRCKCGFLHAHIQHDCSSFKDGGPVKASPQPKVSSGFSPPETVVERMPIPDEMLVDPNAAPPDCKICGTGGTQTAYPCSLPCFVRAGYKAERYDAFVQRRKAQSKTS